MDIDDAELENTDMGMNLIVEGFRLSALYRYQRHGTSASQTHTFTMTCTESS